MISNLIERNSGRKRIVLNISKELYITQKKKISDIYLYIIIREKRDIDFIK